MATNVTCDKCGADISESDDECLTVALYDGEKTGAISSLDIDLCKKCKWVGRALIEAFPNILRTIIHEARKPKTRCRK